MIAYRFYFVNTFVIYTNLLFKISENILRK